MSGFQQIRLYQNTTNTIPGTFTDITSQVIGSATDNSAGNTFDYDNGVQTVTGLSPGTTYYFWVEFIDASNNSSGIQSLGSITTAGAVDDVWEFYSLGSDQVYHTANQFQYTGAGSYVLNYSHVQLFNLEGASATSPTVMDSAVETGFSQLVWSPGSVASPKLLFRITIPSGEPNPIPSTGWSWVHRAAVPEQLGAFRITRNGVVLSHTAETNNPSTGPNPRTIQSV